MNNNKRQMLEAVKAQQARYARIFNGTPWSPDELSDVGWLCLVAVPWLLKEVEKQCQCGNDEREPGSNGVGLTKPAVKLVLPEEPHADASLVVPAGNPLTQFFVRLLAKVKAVFGFHGRKVNGGSHKMKAEVGA